MADADEGLMDRDEGPACSSTRRRSFTVDFKLSVVAYARRTSKKEAAEKFPLSRSRVQEWTSQRGSLATTQKEKKRLVGAGRRLLDPTFDQQMFAYVSDRRSKQLRVTRSMIQRQAKRMAPDGLAMSSGWLVKFMKRHNLTNRRPTTACQKTPIEYESKLIAFILNVAKLRKKTSTNIYTPPMKRPYLSTPRTV